LELEVENLDGKKSVYLVTFSHPQRTHSACGVALRSPDTYNKAWLRDAIIEAFAHPVYANVGNEATGRALELCRFVIVSESHEPGADGVIHCHYHVALQAEGSFRFVPFKRALLQRWGLASHWSTTHMGYWSALRYLVWPSPKKPQTALDPDPLAWQRVGEHARPLRDVAQPPTNAAMIKARREKLEVAAAEAGEDPSRPREIDVWPLVVKHNIRNDHDNNDGVLRLIKVARASCSPEMVDFLFKNRQKLNKLIDDIWTWETVDDLLHLSQRSRVTALEESMRQPCVCGGAWMQEVRKVLFLNGINEAELGHDIYVSFVKGRSETTPVVTLAGKQGGEGKSLIFFPLTAVLGDEFVQGHTASGAFPLLGLEGKKAVLLDEWRFAASALPLAIQLLWLEGKPVPLARPQGEYIGHLLYKGSAPIFITTPLKRLENLERDAATAMQCGFCSEASMVLRRLKVYKFRQAVPRPPAQIPACAACFSDFLFSSEMAWCQAHS